MNVVSLIVRDLWKMFVDDEFLAAAVLAIIGAAALLTEIGLPHLFVGGLLLVGCLSALTVSVLRAGAVD
jgi:hypothetical protein